MAKRGLKKARAAGAAGAADPSPRTSVEEVVRHPLLEARQAVVGELGPGGGGGDELVGGGLTPGSPSIAPRGTQICAGSSWLCA